MSAVTGTRGSSIAPYCHREVARFTEGSGPHTKAARQERTRAAAAERCAELNAWDAAA